MALDSCTVYRIMFNHVAKIALLEPLFRITFSDSEDLI